ncbi:MAG TPA: TetR/AcrR family transcriptional regulator [Phycisphaerales bacterium]|nr:TetR/AcrR family transcriptional regulator [Phycisphaerales bacterium]
MATPTRARLIEEAGDLFYRHGFQAVGLDRVIDAVGISKTALYKHFESKDELIVAVLNERDRKDIADAEAFIGRRADGDPIGQVLALFDQLGEWFRDPEFRGCLFLNAAMEFPSPNDPIHKAADAHRHHLLKLIRTRLAAAGLQDPEFMAQQVMQVLVGAIIARHSGGVADAAEVARATVAGMLGAGVKPTLSR